VGISKVHAPDEFDTALDQGFGYDDKIIIEQYLKGREIECAVLGNEKAVASVPGEVIPTHEFYSYQAKYLDDHGADLIIPADLPESVIDRIQKMAMQAFHALDCEGMARVDFFVSGERIYINELNSIPGFTRISMYPKLWEASGISYADLIDRLIQLALQRHQRQQNLKS
jgi:D-alanine-D-alanine ligase